MFHPVHIPSNGEPCDIGKLGDMRLYRFTVEEDDIILYFEYFDRKTYLKLKNVEVFSGFSFPGLAYIESASAQIVSSNNQNSPLFRQLFNALGDHNKYHIERLLSKIEYEIILVRIEGIGQFSMNFLCESIEMQEEQIDPPIEPEKSADEIKREEEIQKLFQTAVTQAAPGSNNFSETIKKLQKERKK